MEFIFRLCRTGMGPGSLETAGALSYPPSPISFKNPRNQPSTHIFLPPGTPTNKHRLISIEDLLCRGPWNDSYSVSQEP